VKSIAIAVLLLLFFCNASKAQCDTTRWERYGAVLGATLVYSLVDYVGFNEIKKADGPNNFQPPALYRVSTAIFQAGITYALYKMFGLSSAISFNLIWWTWGDDFAYYGWGQLLSWFPWESRAQSGLRFSSYNSAGWTPIGLVRPQGSSIAQNALLAQAVIGFSVSMAIIW
jgi:hypothetical protein